MPDCPAAASPTSIPLVDDLSNAAIATCKPRPAEVTAATTQRATDRATAATSDAANPKGPKIYDDVIRQAGPAIPDHEHQVTQQAQGKLNPTDGSDGPRGKFDNANPPKKGGEQWAPLPPPTFVEIFSNGKSVEVLKFKKNENKKWVELPTCTGATGEIVLRSDLTNATVATCKPSTPL